jgi:hypothetical protein
VTHTSVANTLAMMSSREISEWLILFERADAASAEAQAPAAGKPQPNLRGTGKPQPNLRGT